MDGLRTQKMSHETLIFCHLDRNMSKRSKPCGLSHILLEMLINWCTTMYFPKHNIFILRVGRFLKCLEVSPTWRQSGTKKGRYLKWPYLVGAIAIVHTDYRVVFGHHKPIPIITEPCHGARNSLELDSRLSIVEWRSFPYGETFWFSCLSNQEINRKGNAGTLVMASTRNHAKAERTYQGSPK